MCLQPVDYLKEGYKNTQRVCKDECPKSEVRLTFITTDIEECEENRDNCHRNAECENTIGSFTCTCDDGYVGDGVSCDGI